MHGFRKLQVISRSQTISLFLLDAVNTVLKGPCHSDFPAVFNKAGVAINIDKINFTIVINLSIRKSVPVFIV